MKRTSKLFGQAAEAPEAGTSDTAGGEAAPSSPPIETNVPEPAGGEVELSPDAVTDLLQDDDYDEGEPQPEPAPEPEPEPPPPVDKGEEEPPPETPPEVVPEPVPEPEPAPAAEEKPGEEKPPEPVVPTITPEEAAAQRAKQRDELVNQLTNDAYAMTEDEARDFNEDPAKALPQLAAKLHAEVLEQTVQGIMSFIPGVVQSVIANTSTQSKNESAFFDAWPQLKGHEGAVGQIAQVYRQMNPDKPMAEMIKEVGAHAMISLKLPLEGRADAPAAEIPPAPPPPAPPGGGPAPTPTRKSDNPFDTLVDEFEEEDEDYI